MCSDPVVPKNHGTGLPFNSGLNISRESNVVIKELQEIVALLLLEPDDVSGELWIDIQRLLTGCWVSSNQGVD
jgi:hypothetical protein